MTETTQSLGTGAGPPRPGWWVCRSPRTREERVLLVGSPDYPDGARVELGYDEALETAGSNLVSEAVIVGGRVTMLHVPRHFAPKAPGVWFVEVVEPTSKPSATNLVAFAGSGQLPGALVDPAALAASGVRSGDQLGAMRWYPATGEVDQIYVAPDWRRHHLATSLLAAAAALVAARDWPQLWGDGQRTALGEQLRNSRSWRVRFAELTHLAPPMTPGSADRDQVPS